MLDDADLHQAIGTSAAEIDIWISASIFVKSIERGLSASKKMNKHG